MISAVRFPINKRKEERRKTGRRSNNTKTRTRTIPTKTESNKLIFVCVLLKKNDKDNLLVGIPTEEKEWE